MKRLCAVATYRIYVCVHSLVCRPVPLNVTAAHSYQEEGFTHCSVLRRTLYSVCSELAEDVRASCCQLKKCSVDGFESGDSNHDTLSLSSLKVLHIVHTRRCLLVRMCVCMHTHNIMCMNASTHVLLLLLTDIHTVNLSIATIQGTK